MKITLVGSRFFGASVLEALRQVQGVEIAGVVTIAADDRLALAAQKAGIPVHIQENPKTVAGDAIAAGTDVIIAAHTHARISDEALAKSRLGGVGYHPSLLPRHRGIAAVEWTILSGDPIAGGSVYHLADGWDKGGIAAQDWCFVAKNDDARSLWERALAPMGLKLLCDVVAAARDTGKLPDFMQDESFATKAPMIRRSLKLNEDQLAVAPTTTALIVTVLGADRPGIVSQLSDKAKRFGASWTNSRMSHLSGEFAGMVQLEVPPENTEGLIAALKDLESTGLRVTVAKSDGKANTTGLRLMTLELVGSDQVGIVSKLTAALSDRNISIEQIDTAIVQGATSIAFKVKAELLVPKTVSDADLRKALDVLASEMTVDIGLGG
jgi:glycine cleavage system regulatory protein/folate-dependent phosphoribosylglycinamide formyltransferase PurN